ncbi:hypothetical protein [Promicromonospora sp. NPDC019610]|uniref:ApeA N-terminal domain 1-containing protein n=1 Tax=Promicromonospora sp. NPDC019610 TaxID=3364405 RepID=UPI0037A38BBC
MVIEQLEFGQALAGLLVDESEETPYVGATLTLDDVRGVLVEIPFFAGDETGQFMHVQDWFDSRTPPSNLLFQSVKGPISLFDLRWNGHSSPSGLAAGRGTFRAGETVLGHRLGPLADQLEIQQVRSWLDQLNDWAGLTSMTTNFASDPDNHTSRAHSFTVNLTTDEPVTWEQGAATLTLKSTWRSTREDDRRGRRLLVVDDVVLDSSFPEPRRFEDHLVEQRKLTNLLVLLYGVRIALRRHRLRDDRFVDNAGSAQFVDLLSASTIRERARPMPEVKDRPIAHLEQVGPDGLTTWAENYESWKRFILPAVNTFGRPDMLAEEVVMSTFTSIEAASHKIGKRRGEDSTYRRGRVTTATHAYRCLHLLGISWPVQIASIEGMAQAIANNYNTIKHADRGEFPDPRESILVSQMNRWIIRLLAVHLTGKGDSVLGDHRSGTTKLWKLEQTFDTYQLRITSDGVWMTGGSTEAETLPRDRGGA